MTKIKKIMALLLVLIITASVLPAQAATTAPACVKSAAKAAMDRSGMKICFVVKIGSTGKGTAYMMRLKNGKTVCDRSGAVILGKNTLYRLNKGYHYSFYRSRNIEKKLMTWKTGSTRYRQRYTSNIECSEGASFNVFVHSYVEYKQSGRTWKVCKGLSKNTDGLAMCKEFARYLWSCADPDCPVVFL
jgi:hypothetical protein